MVDASDDRLLVLMSKIYIAHTDSRTWSIRMEQGSPDEALLLTISSTYSPVGKTQI